MLLKTYSLISFILVSIISQSANGYMAIDPPLLPQEELVSTIHAIRLRKEKALKTGDQYLLIQALSEEAEVYEKSNLPKEAVTAYTYLLALEGLAPLQEAVARLKLGNVLRTRLYQYPDAILQYKESSAIALREDSLGLFLEAGRMTGLAYADNGQIDSSIAINNELLTVAQSEEMSEHTAKLLNNLAFNYSQKGRFAIAIPIYQEAIAIADRLNDDALKHLCIQNIGFCFYMLGESDAALAHLHQALDYFESGPGENSYRASRSSLLISYVYQMVNNLLLSNKYALSGYSLASQKHLLDLRLLLSNQLAQNYLLLNNSDSARVFIQHSLEVESETGLKSLETSFSLVDYLIKEGSLLDSASRFVVSRILKDASIKKDSVAFGEALLKLAEIDILQGKDPVTKLDLARNNSYMELAKKVSLTLANWYSGNNQHALAYENLLIHNEYNTKLINEKSTRNIQALQIKYEADKKQAEINYLTEANSLNHKLLIQKDLIIVGSAVIGVMLIVALVLIIQQYRVKKRNEYLTKMLYNEEVHRTQNMLQIINSVASLNDADFSLRISAITSSYDLLRNGHRFLSKKSYLKALIDNVVTGLGEENRIEVTADFFFNEEDISQQKIVILALIITELMTNSIKYSTAGEGKLLLTISLKNFQNNTIFHFSDNGPGIAEERLIAATREAKKGLGLVALLSKELKATYKINGHNGFVFDMQMT